MKNLLLTVIFLAFVVSCSDSLDKEFNKDTFKEDIKTIKESGDIDSSDLATLGKYILKSAFSKEDLEGDTYDDLLAKAKEYEKEQEEERKKQEELARKAREEEQARIEKLKKALTISLLEKDYKEYNYKDYITYKFAFENLTDKKIRAFKGTVKFTDIFDEEITSLSITYDETIKANESVIWDAQTDFNQYKDEDVALRNKELENLKVIWKPEKIMFTDGSELE